MSTKFILAMSSSLALLATQALADTVIIQGDIVSKTVNTGQKVQKLDYSHAKSAMPLVPKEVFDQLRQGGTVPGVSPQESGASNIPFWTTQVPQGLDTSFPFAPTGKLFFNEPEGTFVCTASMILPGIAITAAHCLAAEGKSTFYSGWQFIPSYRNGAQPFGAYTPKTVYIKKGWYDGSVCTTLPCPIDFGLLVLNSNAGDVVGRYGVGMDGYGFTANGLTQIAQLGYPGDLDNGEVMELNSSQGVVQQGGVYIIGSLMGHGASGGPWLVNLGIRPTLTGAVDGDSPANNVVIGVDSFGSNDPTIKLTGASLFTSAGLGSLINTACSKYPENC